MSRGDEFEAGDPRGPSPPPAGYPRYEDDFAGEPAERLPTPPLPRSAAVTAVGIIGIVLGILTLFGGLCLGILIPLMPMLQDLARKNPNDPNMAQLDHMLALIPTWFLTAQAVLSLVNGLGLMIGGIGVVKRSNGGRLLTLAMAALGVVGVLFNLGIGLALGIIEPANAITSIVSNVFTLGFAFFAFAVLLSAKNVAEFRPSSSGP
jgi:hypothetical protein